MEKKGKWVKSLRMRAGEGATPGVCRPPAKKESTPHPEVRRLLGVSPSRNRFRAPEFLSEFTLKS